MPFRPITPPSGVVLKPALQAAAIPSRTEVRARIRATQQTVAVQSPEAPRRQSPVAKELASRPARKHHVVDRSSSNWENGNYVVGRGRPPKETRWKAGQSGNPRGPKPRERPDPETELDNAILAPFATLANGVPEQTNLGVFALNILKAKAAQKDRKAAEILLDLYYTKLRARKPAGDDATILPEEQEMINALLEAAGWKELPAIRNERKLNGEEAADE